MWRVFLGNSGISPVPVSGGGTWSLQKPQEAMSTLHHEAKQKQRPQNQASTVVMGAEPPYRAMAQEPGTGNHRG